MTAPILKFLEVWRPIWLSNEPKVFWRELQPEGRRAWRPSQWAVMPTEFARKLARLPNPYFTLDDSPGVTFCARRLRDKQATDADREAVRYLRIAEQMPREATDVEVTQYPDPEYVPSGGPDGDSADDTVAIRT